ncbi:hypothetical protein M3P05_04345 [Sansalvadorimonas sp. 2012CJ34-2]|uniref:Uncharacterized protein n=1 Tax=Parendozoicomonas callyspongiae TaxID=2942213 RepID=A0ABT0PF62_9GAMM|nr:hypothetical protein [Sansalvadorimonas sp. 2012CJ34-2]MCL6269173.1 hypothetical protein [Sansalvadorimonas sp. 2012CJ34-2]
MSAATLVPYPFDRVPLYALPPVGRMPRHFHRDGNNVRLLNQVASTLMPGVGVWLCPEGEHMVTELVG